MNSRYYDPETGRFINADDISTLDVTKVAINGLNLYAYCLNNPVNEVDESGMFISWLLGLLIACIVVAVVNTAVQLVSDVVDYAITGHWNSSWEDYVGAFLGGLVGGATFFLTHGNLTATFAMINGIESLTTNLLTNATGKTDYSIGTIFLRTAISAGIGALTGWLFGGTKIAGATIGRNSLMAIWKSGLTKLANESATKMSLNVIFKGLAAFSILKSGGSLLGGVFSGISNLIKNFIKGI